MKKKFIARKVKVKPEFNPQLPSIINPYVYKGKYVKKVRMSMFYGATVEDLWRTTGLSLRRLYVMKKQLLGSKRLRIISTDPFIS